MIIDETFMWLYVAYKVGHAFVIPAAVSVLASLVMIPISIESDDNKKVYDIAFKVWKISAFVFPISLFVAVMTPSMSDVHNYAKYKIGENVVNSDDAKRLIEATINKLEE